MKRTMAYSLFIGLFLVLLAVETGFSQGINKRIKVGNFWAKVMDSGDEGEGSWGWGSDPTYFDGFQLGVFSSKAMFLGCKNFTDTTGAANSIKVSGHGQWSVDDRRIWSPVIDQDGYSIHRYMRYQPPSISVDGFRLEDLYPYDFSDHVDASKIPGTADCMVESWIQSDMGITIHQRVLAYSQKNHDDYQIFEWTFKNTGDVPNSSKKLNQTLTDVYFLRQIRQFEDMAKGWASSYGEMPYDTLRILYGYPSRWSTSEWDDFGVVNEETGYIGYPWFMGETTLFGSKAGDVTQDDVNQPRMTGHQDCDLVVVTENSNNLTDTQRQWLYTLMEEGFSTYPDDGVADMPGSKPGHHSPPYDQRGYQFPDGSPWFGWTISSVYAYGPYTLAPGDSFKVVWAQVIGMISPEKAYEVGTDWKDGTCTWGDMVPGGSTDILPPQYQEFPGLYAADALSSETNNWAKDNWVFTGKDSLFLNAYAAKWAFDQNYNVPQAPPPPSIAVTSLPDKIVIAWGNESESAGDFAGYRVYRARGSWYAHIPEEETQFIGSWEPIFECGEGTANALVNSFDDVTAQRGIAYFYYVAAFDNGTDNLADFHGRKQSLESGRFLNMTTQAAYLLKPAGERLSDIRIVPNPFNLAASELQFTGEPDKIMFVNLPVQCTINIFTESGDLVKTIDHLGSGDEAWGKLLEEHSTTNSGQQIVSGIYIVRIETPEGDSIIKKFVVVR